MTNHDRPQKNERTVSDELDKTIQFFDEEAEQPDAQEDAQRKTDPELPNVGDQTVEFDGPTGFDADESPLSKAFGPTGTIVEEDHFLDPQQTFLANDQTVDLNEIEADDSPTLDADELQALQEGGAAFNAHGKTVNEGLGKTFETPTVDLGNPEGIGEFPTMELESGVSSDSSQSIEPDSVLDGNNITQTIDARSLNENDRKIWGLSSDLSVEIESRAQPATPHGPVDRDDITESKVLVPGRQLAGIGADLSLGSDYELIEVLGEGGMGTVYLARQTSLDRLVALKMVRPMDETRASQLRKTGRLDKAENNRRNQFLSEAIVTGDLDHPNIVPIHDLALADDKALFYAMKKVDGIPWSKAIMDKSQDENLEILLKVCDAIGFAHARGVVHRDIKPENVMLGEFGVVMLMDWGLAIPTSKCKKKSSIQKAASLGGSPAYMAPEMAAGPIESIGPASDIYLLGAVLFEIITGRPPHIGNNLTQCLKAAVTNQIVEVSSRHDGELMQIARTAMATKPSRRYASAADLQKAIRQYRSHAESIMMTVRADTDLLQAEESNEYTDFARATFGFEEALTLWPGNEIAELGLDKARVAYATTALEKEDFELGLSLLDDQHENHRPLIEKLQHGQHDRDSRRGRLRLAKQVAVGLVAFILLGGSGALYKISTEKNRAVDAERQARTNARLAEAKRAEALENMELARRSQVEAEYQKGIAQEEADEADRQRAIATQKALEAESNFQLAAANERKAVKNAEEAARQEQIALQQRSIAMKNAEEAIRQRENAVYEAYVAQIGLAKARIDQNEFDDARRILLELKAQTTDDEPPGWEWQWLWQQANQAQDDKPLAAAGRNLAINRTATQAIVTLDDGTTQRIEIDDAGEITTADVGQLPKLGSVEVTAISPDQQTIATAGADGIVRLYDAKTLELRSVLRGHSDEITSLGFVDEQRLISGSRDRTLRLWDLNQQRELAQCWHIAAVNDLSLSVADGRVRVLAVVADERSGRAVVWDLVAGQFERVGDFLEHDAPLMAVALSADGLRAASGDRSGRVLVWETNAIHPVDYASRITMAVNAISGTDAPTKPAAESELRSRQAPSFTELIDLQNDDTLKLTPADSQTSPAAAHTDAIESIEFNDDGTQLLTTSDDYTIKLWDVASNRLTKTLRGHGGWVRDAVFFPGNDGRILSIGNDAAVRVWQPATLHETVAFQSTESDTPSLQTRPHDDEIWSASFNADGTKIVTASRDHTARVLEIDPKTLGFKNTVDLVDEDGRLQEGSPFVALSLAVDPSHNRLFVGSADSTVRVWDLGSGSQISSAAGTGLNTTLAVSSDGSLLVTGSSDEEARFLVWEIDAQGMIAEQPKFRLKQHQTTVTAIAISPDNRLIFTGDRNGLGLLWDSATGKTVGAALNQHLGFRINAAQFTPDSQQLLIAADDQKVSRVDLDTLQLLDVLPHPGFVTRLSIAPDGRSAATLAESSLEGTLTSTVTLWDLSNGKDRVIDRAVRRGEAAEGDAAKNQRIVSVRFGDSETLVTSHDQTSGDFVKIWRLGDAKAAVGQVLQMPKKLATLADAVPMGSDRLLSLAGDAAFLWDLKSLNHIRSYRSHGGVTEADFSFDGKYVVTGSRSIRIWDVASGRSLQKMEVPHDGAVRTVQFSPIESDYTFASGGEDGVCRLWRWDPQQQAITLIKELQVAETEKATIHQVRFSPDGKYLLSVGDDAVARVWSVNQDQPPRLFKDKESDAPFLCGAFSDDGQWIAVGSEDRQARVWQLTDDGEGADTPRSVLQGHADQIEAIGFLGSDPRQRRIMTASRDKSARLWDPRLSDRSGKGREILALRKHSLGLTAVDATRDGSLMMTASRDGTIILWPAGYATPTM